MEPPATGEAVITPAEVAHLAKLAALSLTEEETRANAVELAKIVAYVQELSAVDTSEVDAMTSGDAGQAWREDVVTPGLSHEDALAGAPRAADGGFAVPGFVSGAGTP